MMVSGPGVQSHSQSVLRSRDDAQVESSRRPTKTDTDRGECATAQAGHNHSVVLERNGTNRERERERAGRNYPAARYGWRREAGYMWNARQRHGGCPLHPAIGSS
jgi:hypothetical protein